MAYRKLSLSVAVGNSGPTRPASPAKPAFPKAQQSITNMGASTRSASAQRAARAAARGVARTVPASLPPISPPSQVSHHSDALVLESHTIDITYSALLTFGLFGA